jgi:hypothetical protein
VRQNRMERLDLQFVIAAISISQNLPKPQKDKTAAIDLYNRQPR